MIEKLDLPRRVFIYVYFVSWIFPVEDVVRDFYYFKPAYIQVYHGHLDRDNILQGYIPTWWSLFYFLGIWYYQAYIYCVPRIFNAIILESIFLKNFYDFWTVHINSKAYYKAFLGLQFLSTNIIVVFFNNPYTSFVVGMEIIPVYFTSTKTYCYIIFPLVRDWHNIVDIFLRLIIYIIIHICNNFVYFLFINYRCCSLCTGDISRGKPTLLNSLLLITIFLFV